MAAGSGKICSFGGGKGTESTPFRAVRRVGRLYNQRSCAGSNHIYNRVRRPRGGVKATGR